ncbi:MAG: hypothetical protein RBS39_00095 [Phycisphaerales bacterium]|jgi:hypothetical protein|nr:hypothetical protein [Phycisphaerales bacterium]
MFTATLDGTPLELSEPTLREALRAAVERAEAGRSPAPSGSGTSGGRIIVEALFDGRPLPAELLENPPTDRLDAGTLALTTADPVEVVRQTLLDACAAIGQLRSDQRAAADAIREGRLEHAIAPMQECLGVWQAIRDVVDHGSRLLPAAFEAGGTTGSGAPQSTGSGGTPAADRQPGGEPVAGGELGLLIERLGGSLRELQDALRSQDFATLGDLLGYDLDEQAGQWHDALSRARERAGA